MQPFSLLVFSATAVVLLWRIWRLCKRKQLPPGGIKIWIIVKNQEQWIEGFVRKLFWVARDSDSLVVYIEDDNSRDCTAEILFRLGRIYPLRTLAAGEERLENEGPAPAPRINAGLQFDVRSLAGKGLLNAPLFGCLSHLNAGKPKTMSN